MVFLLLVGCTGIQGTPPAGTVKTDPGSQTTSAGSEIDAKPAESHEESPEPENLPPPSSVAPSSVASSGSEATTGPSRIELASLVDGSKELVIPMTEFGPVATFANGVIHFRIVDPESSRPATMILETVCQGVEYTGTALRAPVLPDPTTLIRCRTLQTGVAIRGDGQRLDQAGESSEFSFYELNRRVVSELEEAHRKTAAAIVDDLQQEMASESDVTETEVTIALTEELMDQIRDDQMAEVPAPIREVLATPPERQSPEPIQAIARAMTDPSLNVERRREVVREALQRRNQARNRNADRESDDADDASSERDREPRSER